MGYYPTPSQVRKQQYNQWRHDRRDYRKAKAQWGKNFGSSAGYFGQFLVGFLLIFILGIPIVFLLVILCLTFIIRTFINVIKRIKHKDKRKVFVKTEFDSKIYLYVKKLWNKLGVAVSRNNRKLQKMDEQDRKSKLRNSPWGNANSSNERYCEICGSRLGGGRKRYCSSCRPTYQKEPFDY